MSTARFVRPLAAAMAAALAAAPAALHAQESDALPFQAGRWAVEVSSQEELGSLGFLRFTAPGSAWVIAPGIIVGRAEASQEDPFGGTEDADISTLGFDLRLGYRSYRSLGRSVVSHLGIGVLGATRSDEAEFSDGTSADTKTTSFGPYGELGGSYFFTPRFGVGASATASLTYDRVEDTSFGDVEIDGWTFALPQTRLLVTIVF
jgi:hypothetical protein